MNPTKEKLMVAAADTLRESGIAGVSARAVAARAGVNQALIFYHFGTVLDLVDVACRQAVDQSAQAYREEFATVSSLDALLAVGRSLNERERKNGNIALMAQLMSGAQNDETLAGSARYAMSQWNDAIEVVVRRVLGGSPLSALVDPAGLTRAITSGFIGVQLVEGVDAEGAASALDALEDLVRLVGLFDDLGPIAQKAIRARVRRAGPKSGR